MRVTIIGCVFGFLAFGESKDLVDVALFPKAPMEIAKRLHKIREGGHINEVVLLVKKLQKKDYDLFVFEDSIQAKKVSEELIINTEVVTPSEAGKIFRENLEKFALNIGVVKNSVEIHNVFHEVTMELVKLKIKEAAEERDLVVVQAIQSIFELDKTINLFISRVREWYGLHFPELDRLLAKHEIRINLISKLGGRKNFTINNLRREGLSTKAEKLANAAHISMGAGLNDEDIDQIQEVCKIILHMFEVRTTLESYVDLMMEKIAPNIYTVAGPNLGASLIAIAGGLNNLAKMPASTIQVLGAEKALFRTLKTGSRPPKHGVIFQHALLRKAKRRQRGRVARALAGKLAIAARVDAFRGKFIGDELNADLIRRINDIDR
ncbi:MAG: C/D box methylation guide ribonucleoprotein complex aNOP56 subunit [Candidatus Hodarchaeota archaeon]